MAVRLKYKVINTEKQYFAYCKKLEALVTSGNRQKYILDEIKLLRLLIEKWDSEHSPATDSNPVELLASLMKDHHLKASDLARILDISRGYVSDILHYKKGFSKTIIRKLSVHFKLSQEAFNRPYKMEQIPD